MSRILILVFVLVPSTALAQEPMGNSAFGNALILNGTDAYAWMSPNLSGASEGTVEMWVSPTSTPNSYQVWTGGNGLPGTTGDWLMLGKQGLHPGFGMGIYASGWRWAGVEALPVTSWTHVAGTWSADGMKLYVNGGLVGEYSHTGGAPGYAMELIGASAWGVSFEGGIDDVRIWNVVRSGSEIQSAMGGPLGASVYGNAGSGLVAYYRFESFEDLGVGADGADDLRDDSVNGNHADAEGGAELGWNSVPVTRSSWSALKNAYDH